jgi:hypothetical protein
MSSLRTLLIASSLVFAAVSAAQADPAAGSYKLAIGSNATCEITLAADGSATYTADCAQGAGVAKWQAKYNGVELKTASGETVAILKGKNGSFAGARFADGRSLTLSPDTSAIASNH